MPSAAFAQQVRARHRLPAGQRRDHRSLPVRASAGRPVRPGQHVRVAGGPHLGWRSAEQQAAGALDGSPGRQAGHPVVDLFHDNVRAWGRGVDPQLPVPGVVDGQRWQVVLS
jgi:hypothetical protein